MAVKNMLGGKSRKRKAEYPADHKPGMEVPKGGSSCASCEYLGKDQKTCTNKYFIKWNGSALIPAPIDEYCSDWFETADKDEEDEQ
jgi:hypothetical protein